VIVSRRLALGLTLSVVVTGAATAALAPRDVDELPAGFESPVVALQLARTVDEAALVLDGDERRRQFVRATVADVPFAAATTALWAVMAWQLRPWLAAPALVGGVADLLENVAILAAVDGPTPVVVGWLRRAARTKWLMLGLTFVGLGFGAWRRTLATGWEVVGLGIDVAYLWAGILCLVGVTVHEPVIERCALPLAAAVITQLAVAVFRPGAQGVPDGAPRSPSSHAA
jgi:hypothetical protein